MADMRNRKTAGMKQPKKPVPFKPNSGRRGDRINQVSGGGSM
jgi:hypothetical protein